MLYFCRFAKKRAMRSKSDYVIERTEDLISSYSRCVESLGYNARFMNTRDIITLVVNSEAPRYYCSFDEAYRVVSRIIKGKQVKRKSALNQRMYIEIAQRVKLFQENYKVNLRVALTEVLYTPASCYFVGVACAMYLINGRIKK